MPLITAFAFTLRGFFLSYNNIFSLSSSFSFADASWDARSSISAFTGAWKHKHQPTTNTAKMTVLSMELLLVDLVLHGHSRSIIYLESDQSRLESKLKFQNKPSVFRERENDL